VITWTIGATGLLGSALVRQARTQLDVSPISWQDPPRAREQLIAGTRALATRAQDAPWRILWAAGASTVATTADQTHAELLAVESLASAIADHGPRGPGTVFLASSAGGVYAGSHPAPFSNDTPIAPISPYGILKAEQEAVIRSLGSTCHVVIGRIANLYGPSQRLDKAQGLISMLVRAAATRQSLNIFVPLDTMRDYVFVDDAARAILSACEPSVDPGVRVEVIASGRAVTIGHLIRLVEVVTKRKVPVALGSHPSASHQVRDLRLQPTIDVPDPTPLPAGIRMIFEDAVHRLQSAHSTHRP